jgi:hypothetical protein
MDKTGKLLIIAVGVMISCIITLCLTQKDITCRFDSCFMSITDCNSNQNNSLNNNNCTLIISYKPNSYCYEICEYDKCPKNNSVCTSGTWTKNCDIDDKCNTFAQVMYYVSIIILTLSSVMVAGWFAIFWNPIYARESQPLMSSTERV